MPLVGVIISRVDPRKMLAAGLVGAGFSLIALSHLNLNAGYWDLFFPQFFQGFFMAMLFVPLTTITMDHVAKEEMGNATSLFNLMRNIGGSIGISAVTTLIARRQQVHQTYLVRNTFESNPRLQQMASGLAQHFRDRAGPVEAMRQSYGRIYGLVQRQAVVLAYIDIFWIMGALCLLAIGLVFFAKKVKPGKAAMAH